MVVIREIPNRVMMSNKTGFNLAFFYPFCQHMRQAMTSSQWIFIFNTGTIGPFSIRGSWSRIPIRIKATSRWAIIKLQTAILVNIT